MEDKIRLTLRIPFELDEKLEKIAKEIGISKNALITKILWEAIEKTK